MDSMKSHKIFVIFVLLFLTSVEVARAEEGKVCFKPYNLKGCTDELCKVDCQRLYGVNSNGLCPQGSTTTCLCSFHCV
ncbi:hypothetical protein K1719_035066 [Acacia pycnantha]|nr:hypothetical protein K1719_035066 [Acacia pycnantha]